MANSLHSHIIAFTRGVPADEAIPIQEIADCFQATLNVNTLQYGKDSAGYLPLREHVANWFGATPDQVIITNGSLHVLNLLSQMCHQEGTNHLVEAPTYDRALQAFGELSHIAYPLQGDGIATQFVNGGGDCRTGSAYLIPDFQNPTGVTLSTTKRQAIIDWARQKQVLIIEDIPYRELRYKGDAPPLLRDFGYENVITVGSFSKLIAPGLRVGFAVGPLNIIGRLRQCAEKETLRPVLPTQAVVAEYFRRDLLPAQIERLKALYAPRCHAAIEAVRTHLPQANFWEPHGGFFLGLWLPEDSNTKNLQQRAKALNLELTNGAAFYPNGFTDMSSRFVRLPFSALASEAIEEGVRRLATLI